MMGASQFGEARLASITENTTHTRRSIYTSICVYTGIYIDLYSSKGPRLQSSSNYACKTLEVCSRLRVRPASTYLVTTYVGIVV